MTITAKEVVSLLSAKHANDIGFPETKTGPAEKGVLKFDYWAMTPSWANFRAYGYEVKVSRKDFLGDLKWKGYLGFCTDFYFVAPPGIIKADELPPEAGFMEVAKTGTRLYTRKKAPSRDVRIPQEIFIYALMWRMKRSTEASVMREFAANRKTAAEAGRALGRRMAKELDVEARRLIRERVEFERTKSHAAEIVRKAEAAHEEYRAIHTKVRRVQDAAALVGALERAKIAIAELLADI